jgi:hypothetical protein
MVTRPRSQQALRLLQRRRGLTLTVNDALHRFQDLCDGHRVTFSCVLFYHRRDRSSIVDPEG